MSKWKTAQRIKQEGAYWFGNQIDRIIFHMRVAIVRRCGNEERAVRRIGLRWANVIRSLTENMVS